MFHHDSNSTDYNVPPCCAQKYFRALFAHLKEHTNTTLFVQPDFDLARLFERTVAHVPLADVTVAIPRLDTSIADSLAGYLAAPCSEFREDNTFVMSNRIKTLTLISQPPQPRQDPKTRITTTDERPRKQLLNIFRRFGDRVRLAESDIATTIILFRSKETTIAYYGNIIQHATTTHQRLRLLHATTDPLIINELERVLRIHSHRLVNKG